MATTLLLTVQLCFAVEFEIGPPTDIDPAEALTGDYAGDVGVATDGSNWLVVGSFNGQLQADLISGDGTRLPPGRLAIGSSLQLGPPAVVFDGENYLVIWVDESIVGSEATIRMRAVTPAGEMGEPTILAKPGVGAAYELFASSLGSTTLIVWRDREERAHWMLLNGTLLGQGTLEFAERVYGIGLAASDSGWLLATATTTTLQGVRFGTDGTVRDAVPFSIFAGYASDLSIAAADDGWAVAFRARDGIQAVRVASDTATTPVPEPLYATSSAFPDTKLLRTRSGYVLFAFETISDLAERVLLRTFAPDLSSTSDPIAVEPGSFDATGTITAGVRGDEILLGWSSERGWRARRVTTSGEFEDPGLFWLLSRANQQTRSDAAYRDGRWFVSWFDRRGPDSGIFGRLLDHSGAPTANVATRISNGVPRGRPRVAAGNGSWLNVWTNDGYSVVAKRLDADATAIDSEAIVLGESLQEPAAAFDGVNWGVAWESSTQLNTVMFQRIAADGSLVDDQAIAVSAGLEVEEWTVGVDHVAGAYRVFWVTPSAGLYEQWLDASGQLVYQAPLLRAATASVTTRPAIAHAPTRDWLLWQDTFSGRLMFADTTRGSRSLDVYSASFDLVAVADSAMSAWVSDSGSVDLGITNPAGTLESVPAFTALAYEPNLAFDGQDSALLTYTEGRTISGRYTPRIAARVVTIQRDDPTNEGGAGGSAGAPGHAGDDAGGNANAGGTDGQSGNVGVPEAGAPSEPSDGGEPHSTGGEPNSSGGRSGSGGRATNPSAGRSPGGRGGVSGATEPGDEPGSRIIRTKGCGCRVGAAEHHGASLVLLLSTSLTLLRRRRVRQAQSLGFGKND